MAILSTNQKLVRVGQEYSAGSGISIDDYVISYTGDEGREYSAGDNIGINDYVISSRNWTPDITYAAESAFQRANEYTNTQISALSGEVSSEVSQLGSDIESLSGDVAYISGVALTAHQSLEGYLTKASGDEYYQPIGSYATVSQLESTSGEIVNLIPTDYVNTETLEQTSGNIVNLIPDTSEFITNVSAEQTYQPIGNYLSSNALEGYATQDWVGEQGYITGVDLSNFYTKNETSGADELEQAFSQIGPGGDAEVNELVHSNSANWNNVSAKLDESVFQETSGLFLTAIPQEYITESDIPNFISGKLDTDVFAGVSGDFLVASSLNGYATESFVENVSADITALIPSDYATNTQVNELSGAIDYVSANAGDQEVHNIVHTNSATWDSVTNKLDTTAFSEVSGTFLTAHQSLDGYATETLVEETSGAITSLIPTDYYPDTNPSGFITGVDLTPYQTIAGMTAYQPVGDYATTNELEQVSADITATIPSTAGLASESYVQTNSAVLTGMIDGKQDTLTFGYDEQDRINSINNSALAGGGDVPEDVMVETNLEYNAVNEISGYNGSAIAQYGAEKQWLQHDDTIVSISNSAQYAFGCNISALQRLMGIDETVLFSGDIGAIGGNITFNEPVQNFNKIGVYLAPGNDNPVIAYYPTDTISTARMAFRVQWAFNYIQDAFIKFVPVNDSTVNFKYDGNTLVQYRHNTTGVWTVINDTTYLTSSSKLRVIGIGRKQ